MEHSGFKIVAPIYERTKSITDEYNQVIGEYLNTKFVDKWDRAYRALVEESYDPLHSMVYTEEVTKTINDNVTKTGNDTDVTKEQYKETTTRNTDDRADVYGFNSFAPVGNNTSKSNGTDVVTGNEDDNKTTTDSEYAHNDRRELTEYNDIIKQGRDTDGASLIDKELDMRQKYILFNIIYNDIDSVFALQIY